MDNLTAILYKTDDIRMEQTPIPTPGKRIYTGCLKSLRQTLRIKYLYLYNQL